MFDDEVLRGVRAAREEIAREYDHDWGALVAALQAADEAGDWPVAKVGELGPKAEGTTAGGPALETPQAPELIRSAG